MAVLQTRGLLRPGRRAAGWMLVGVAAFIAVLCSSHEFMAEITMYDIVAQPSLIALLFAAAVVAAASLAEVRMPGAAAARIVARLAYALYLTHYALVPLSLALVRPADGTVAAYWTAAAYWTVFLGLSLASALAVHYLCEKPFLIARGAHTSAE